MNRKSLIHCELLLNEGREANLPEQPEGFPERL
jgi:hypothetical protein